MANKSFVARDDTGFSFGIDSTKVWLSEIIHAFLKTLWRGWEKQAKYHLLKTNLIIFPFSEVNISYLERDGTGFSFGKYITEVWLSEITPAFPKPLGRRREKRDKIHPKIILAMFKFKFYQNLHVKNIFFTLNLIYIDSTSSNYTHLNR